MTGVEKVAIEAMVQIDNLGIGSNSKTQFVPSEAAGCRCAVWLTRQQLGRSDRS